jgi:hypothetical protein
VWDGLRAPEVVLRWDWGDGRTRMKPTIVSIAQQDGYNFGNSP